MKLKLVAAATSALLLCGCGKVLDFRNAEISNNRIFEEGSNEPFTGSVTNVPLRSVVMPKIGELLQFAGDVTHDKSVSGMMLGAAMGQLLGTGGDGPILCDVHVDDGKLDGAAVCQRSDNDRKVFEFEYEDNTPTGAVKIFNPQSDGDLFASATLGEDGLLSGKSEVFSPESGELAGTATWVKGKLNGPVEGYDVKTGKRLRVGTMKDGLLDGEFLTYAADGETLVKKQTFSAGKLNGTYEEYSEETGQLLKKATYEEGVNITLRQDRDVANRPLAQKMVDAGLATDLTGALEMVRGRQECVDTVSANYMASNKVKDVPPSEVARLSESCDVWTEERVAELAAPAPSPSEDDQCVEEWAAAHRAEVGEDAVVTQDQLNEWRDSCSQGAHPSDPT